MTKEVWLVVGSVEDNTSHGGLYQGHLEYQFCEAPPGKRVYEDSRGRQYLDAHPDKPAPCTRYIDLQKGLADHSGCIIHWVGKFKTFNVSVKLTEKREIEGWVSIKAGSPEHARDIVMHGAIDGVIETQNIRTDVRVKEASDIHEAE